MAILQILIVFTILFGTSTFKLNYSEYVTMLSLMGFHTGVTLFCWMVVFTFRKNLLMTAKYSLAPSQSAGRAAVAFARAGIFFVQSENWGLRLTAAEPGGGRFVKKTSRKYNFPLIKNNLRHYFYFLPVRVSNILKFWFVCSVNRVLSAVTVRAAVCATCVYVVRSKVCVGNIEN